MKVFFWMALLFLLVGKPTLCFAQDMFVVEDISRFDGKSWGGLTLGESSTADIKKMFKTSKGAVRPEAMVLPQPEKSAMRVDVLMNGRGPKSLLTGFRLAYADGGPDVKALTDMLKVTPETWYPHEHFDDWRLETFPERGVVAFVEGSGRTERVSLVLLCAPSHVRDVIATCEHQSSRPLNIQDVYPDSKRVVEIGQIHVDITCDKGIKLDKSDDVQRDLERQVWRMRTPREIDVHTGSTGTWNVKLELSFTAKDHKATVSATADMAGTTLLGRVTASAQSSDTYREDSDSPVWFGARKLERTMFDALDRVLSQMSEKVRKQPLPTLAVLRLRAWDALIDQGTK